MLKTLIKLAIAAAVLNATFHAGVVAAHYYELKDATQQMLTFGSQAATGDLHNQILEKAAELDVPLASEDLVVHRQGTRTWMEASYDQPVEYFPNQSYPVHLTLSVEVYSLNPGRPEDER